MFAGCNEPATLHDQPNGRLWTSGHTLSLTLNIFGRCKPWLCRGAEHRSRPILSTTISAPTVFAAAERMPKPTVVTITFGSDSFAGSERLYESVSSARVMNAEQRQAAG
jgi:hypothetical protein